MKKLVLIAALGLGLAGASRAGAEDAPKSRLTSLQQWFKHLKEGLSESSVSGYHQKGNLAAVAAVRGAQQDAVEPNKPRWKGGNKAKRAEQMRRERAELSKSVDLIVNGQVKDGMAGLDSFEKAHPKSSLLPQVEEARAKAKELEAAAAVPEAQPN